MTGSPTRSSQLLRWIALGITAVGVVLLLFSVLRPGQLTRLVGRVLPGTLPATDLAADSHEAHEHGDAHDHAHDEHAHDEDAHDEHAHDHGSDHDPFRARRNAVSAESSHDAHDAHEHGDAAHDSAHAADDHSDHDGHAHEDEHDHAHEDENENTLTLSPQAMGNLGLTPDYLRPVALQTFRRTITVPAMVVERPGRTRLEVATPMAGVITHVHAVQGESVQTGSLLFELRITAEELVSTQTEMLRALGELDVENREVTRLTDVTRSGAIPQKTLIERQYAREKLEVLLAAQKEALRLQGLSDRQIGDIEKNRRLLRDLQIVAPSPDDHSHEELHLTQTDVQPVDFEATEPKNSELADGEGSLMLQEVRVHKGEIVAAGATLAVVADLAELYIEGRAFEQDAALLSAAFASQWPITAIVERAGKPPEIIADLELLYAANHIEVESRTLRFYVRLPNQTVRDVPSPNGQRFVDWKYRPGQRMQLRVPVEEWTDQIVLPVEAIAQEGAETFVFRRKNDRFERVPVRVEHRDQTQVVVKNDGSLSLGDSVAHRGAHQLQMALKNKSGGGVDPHAGHSH